LSTQSSIDSVLDAPIRTTLLGLGGAESLAAEPYKRNLNLFLRDIDVLDGEIQHTLAGLEKERLVVFHPSRGLFRTRLRAGDDSC